jgi:general stress protein YciG
MTYEFEPAARGFAAMDEEQQRAIARKGGQAVSENRQHMAEIGRKGGRARGSSLSSSSPRSLAGRKGGRTSHKNL